jgi:hypothetical protein
MFSPKTLLGSALAIATLCSTQTLFAQNYYVGTCKPGKGTFYTSIQQAVTEAPSGTIINICPGTYAEQVTIQQPLTLKGMQNGNSAAVIITVPGGGLSPVPVSNSFGDGAAAQLQVINSGGPVNISGIVVDGTGVTNRFVAAILYESSPGTLDHVITRNLADPVAFALGILVLDDSALSPTVTIQNSFLTHRVSGGNGVTVFAGASDVSANIANNYISLPGNSVGIRCATQGPGTITGNVISEDGAGVFDQCPAETISGNTITGPNGIILGGNGISLGVGATINGNTINATGVGINNVGLDQSPVIKGNQIFNAGVGIDLGCHLPATVSGNQFIGTAVGLANVPTGSTLDKTAGNFFGVPTIQQLCSN